MTTPTDVHLANIMLAILSLASEHEEAPVVWGNEMCDIFYTLENEFPDFVPSLDRVQSRGWTYSERLRSAFNLIKDRVETGQMLGFMSIVVSPNQARVNIKYLQNKIGDARLQQFAPLVARYKELVSIKRKEEAEESRHSIEAHINPPPRRWYQGLFRAS